MGQLYNIAKARLYPPLFSLPCLLTLHAHLSWLLSLSSPPSSLHLYPFSSPLLSFNLSIAQWLFVLLLVEVVYGLQGTTVTYLRVTHIWASGTIVTHGGCISVYPDAVIYIASNPYMGLGYYSYPRKLHQCIILITQFIITDLQNDNISNLML